MTVASGGCARWPASAASRIETVAPDTIDELASGRTHGGVIALVGPRRERSVGTLLAEVGERSLIVMLDGIEDPFNFGQAVRALYAAGVDGLVVRRSWETGRRHRHAGVRRRQRADSDRANGVRRGGRGGLRRCGMRIACAVASEDAVELSETDLSGGLFVLIGGERRGVTRSFVDQADLRVRIGYGRERCAGAGCGHVGGHHRLRGAAPAAVGELEDSATRQAIGSGPSDGRSRQAAPDALADGEAGDEVESGQRHQEAVADRQRADLAADGGSTDHGQAADAESRDGE